MIVLLVQKRKVYDPSPEGLHTFMCIFRLYAVVLWESASAL